MDRFGTRLRDARLALGLSQAAAAADLLDASELALIESGRGELEPSVASALAARMCVSVEADASDIEPRLRTVMELEAALRRGDWRAAEALLQEEAIDPSLRLFFSAFVYERQGDFDAARAALTSALALNSAPLLHARIMLALCRCARDSGALGDSARIGESALEYIQTSGLADEDLQTELRATLAGTYCETGDLVRSLDLTEPAQGASSQGSWGAVTRLWARSMTLQAMGRIEQAQLTAQEALLVLRPLDRPTTLARMQNAAAWIYMQTPGFDAERVQRMLDESAEVFRLVGAPVELALVLTSQAELAALEGDGVRADRHLGEALSLMSAQDAGERARITAAAAQIYASVGDVEVSMQHLLTARELLESSGARRSAAATWKQMAETYAALGHIDLQLACLRAAMELLDLQ